MHFNRLTRSLQKNTRKNGQTGIAPTGHFADAEVISSETRNVFFVMHQIVAVLSGAVSMHRHGGHPLGPGTFAGSVQLSGVIAPLGTLKSVGGYTLGTPEYYRRPI